MKKHTILILTLALATPALASDKIDLWGPAAAPKQEQPAPAPEPTPKSLVDSVESVIQKGEALEQQGRRLKRLFDK